MTPSYHEINNAIRVIAQAKHDGRPIVPLIGGGISAECGIPATAELVRYFAALRYYLREQVYLPEAWRGKKSHPLDQRLAEYGKILEYVKDFNWPELRQLTHSLRGLPTLPDGLDWMIADELDRLAREMHPDKVNVLEQAASSQGRGRRSWLWDAVGDWKELLRYMTDSDPDYAELLIARLHRSHRPGLCHRFLAFLANVLGIRLILTTTIDSLLEEALTAEGIEHRVFSLRPGRPFPAPEMVRDSFAVLKLHGDASTLFVDDRRSALWERDVLQRFQKAYPKDALLLVLGCSGQGRLIMDLIEYGVLAQPRGQERASPRVVWVHYEEKCPAAVERMCSRQPALTGRRALHTAGVKQPGLFLRHLYTALTSRYPASTIPYATHSEQPTLLRHELASEVVDPAVAPGAPAKLRKRQDEPGLDPPFVLFDNLRCDGQGRPPRSPPPILAPSASERLAEWMNDQTSENELVPIWIDLEGHYTLPDVVSAILERCRLFDPLLAPSVLPLNEQAPGQEDDPTLHKAVDRVAEALRRRRYVVAFDSFEAFIWPQTAHHGTTTKIRSPENRPALQGRLHRLTLFLKHLAREVRDAARLGVSVNLPQGRHGQGPDTVLVQIVRDEVQELVQGWACKELEDPPRNRDEPHTQLSDAWEEPAGKLRGILVPQRLYDPAQDPLAGDRAALALLCLSCFRRTRSLIALRSLLSPLLAHPPHGPLHAGLGPSAEVDRLIAWYCATGFLIPLEGGMYWMPCQVRDTLYRANSSCTDTDRFRRLTAEQTMPNAPAAAAQLLLLALQHDRIARYYYFEAFLMSKDPAEFFEYVYHRVSSIRYLTKLDLLLECEPLRAQVESACARLAEVIPRAAEAGEQPLVPAETLAHLEEGQVRAEVRERRQREIASLRLAWSMARAALQSQAAAELLSSWCEWLIRDDFPRFQMGYYFPSAARTGPFWEQCAALDRDCVHKPIAELQDDLYDLWAQCYLERTDYRRSIEVCTDQLQTWIEHAAGPEQEPALHQLSALRQQVAAGSIAWSALADAFPLQERYVTFLLKVAEGGIRSGEKVSPLLSQLRKRIQRQMETTHEEMRPEFLLCLRLCSEARLVLAERQRAAVPVLARTRVPRLRLAKHVERGLVEIRPLVKTALVPSRQSYFRFRSQFLLTRGKIAWLSEEEGAFKRAYQDFELARGYIKESGDRTFRAEVDLHAAACALAHANWLLRPDNPDASAAFETLLRRAEAKYDMVNGYLRLAFDHLLNGRRNVVWWKEYAQLFCTYKSQRNLLRLTQLAENWVKGERRQDAASPNFAGDRGRRRGDTKHDPEWIELAKATARAFTRTLRQGLQTVRSWLDVEIDGARALARSGQPRLVIEMLLTGLCFGRLACLLLRDKDFTPDLLQYWTWLLKSTDLLPILQEHLPREPAVLAALESLWLPPAPPAPLLLRALIREKARKLTL